MEQFLATARPRKENWLQSMTEEEKAVMGQHFAYVNQMFSKGKILFSGACLDGVMGIIVYQGESYETVKEIFENDPLVKSGITETELHPFKAGHLQNNPL